MENLGIVTSAEIQKRSKSRVSVHVDGQYLGSVDNLVWVKSSLKVGEPLSATLWEDMQGRQEAAAALDKAVRRLAARARGRAELERYLIEKGFSDAAVQSAVAKLTEYGYVDDEAFAAMVVRDRTGLKAVGRRSVAQELKRMGIGEEDAAKAMEQYGEDDELAAAVRQAEKDFRRTAGEGDERKRRAKVYAGLARRGFSGDVIETAMSSVFSGPSGD